jgi:hypothetical protein
MRFYSNRNQPPLHPTDSNVEPKGITLILNATTEDGINWYCLDGCRCPADERDIPKVDTLHVVLGLPAGKDLITQLGYLPGVLQGTARVLIILDEDQPKPQIDNQPFWLHIVWARVPISYLIHASIAYVPHSVQKSDLNGLSLTERLHRMESGVYKYITVTDRWVPQLGLTVPNTTEPIPMRIVDAMVM